MPVLSRSKGRLFGAALFLLLLAGGGWLFACPKVVAVVGEASISEADIGYRIGMELAYEVTVERPAALVALVNDVLEHEVAHVAGVEASDKELAAFSQGVDEYSKAPEVLEKVKAVFAEDDAAYRRLYLAPKLINRKLRAWFSRDALMQKKSREAIQKAYALAVAGNDLEQVAKATGLKFAEQAYKAEQKNAPDALKAYFPKGMAMLTAGFQKLLDGLKPGEMADTIAEDDSSYRIVRLLEKTEGSYQTVEIIAVKAPFDAWFSKQAKKTSVRIQDDNLRAAIAAKYPNLAWNPSGEDREGK